MATTADAAHAVPDDAAHLELALEAWEEDVEAWSQERSAYRRANRQQLRPFLGFQLGLFGGEQVNFGGGARVALGVQQHLLPRLGWVTEVGAGFYSSASDAFFPTLSASAVLGPFGRFVMRGGVTAAYLDVERKPPDADPSAPTSPLGFVFGPRLGLGVVLGRAEELYLGARLDYLAERFPIPEDQLVTGAHVEVSMALGTVRRELRPKPPRPSSP